MSRVTMTYDEAIALSRELPHILQQLEPGDEVCHYFGIAVEGGRPLSLHVTNCHMKPTKRNDLCRQGVR